MASGGTSPRHRQAHYRCRRQQVPRCPERAAVSEVRTAGGRPPPHRSTECSPLAAGDVPLRGVVGRSNSVKNTKDRVKRTIRSTNVRIPVVF